MYIASTNVRMIEYNIKNLFALGAERGWDNGTGVYSSIFCASLAGYLTIKDVFMSSINTLSCNEY